MATAPSALEVLLGDRPVGYLTKLSKDEVDFTFADEYAGDRSRPTLSLGYATAHGGLRRPKRALGGKVQPFFSNLLPEAELREYVADRARVDKGDEFALLWITGSDLPGAVVVRDPDHRPLPPADVGGPKRPPPTGALLRFSLAGVQLKFSAVKNARGGLTVTAGGKDGDFIVKLPSAHFKDVPENEFAMASFARRIGIDVPETRLIDLDAIAGLPAETRVLKGKALAVKRFDRAGHRRRIHIEDFNQIYRQYPASKYDNFTYDRMAHDIYHFAGGAEALEAFVGRLVFNLAICNGDMHLKNWSVIYRDGRTPSLSPAYDLVCTSIYQISGRDECALEIGGTRRFDQVSDESFERLALRADVSKKIVMTAARRARASILAEWRSIRQDIAVVKARARIDEQLKIVPFFNERKRLTSVKSAATEREVAREEVR